MLQPLSDSNLGLAVDLLARSPWKRTKRYWETCLERIQTACDNSKAGVPIGHLLMADGLPAGIILTLASERIEPDGAHRLLINLSTWFIEPAQRWRAPLMMRAAMRHPGAVFTDFSPSAAVEPMLPAYGFTQISKGESAVPLLLSGLKGLGGGARMVPLDGAPVTMRPGIARLLRQHEAFGCFTAALVENDRCYPLLFKRRTMKGIPAARLAYCEDNTAVYRNLGTVGRHLMRRGCQILVLDIPMDDQVPGFLRPHRGKKFARGGSFGKGTDFLGSELCLFDI